MTPSLFLLSCRSNAKIIAEYQAAAAAAKAAHRRLRGILPSSISRWADVATRHQSRYEDANAERLATASSRRLLMGRSFSAIDDTHAVAGAQTDMPTMTIPRLSATGAPTTVAADDRCRLARAGRLARSYLPRCAI